MNARDPLKEHDGDSEEGFDVDALKDKLGFVARAPRRRPKLAIAILLVVAGLGVTTSMTMPRVYNTRSTLSIFDTSVPGGSRDPFAKMNVPEMIMRRENLTALAVQANP